MSAQTLAVRPVRNQELQLISETNQLGTKTCPQCGQVLFDDMSVCYGCLYDFSREGTRHVPILPEPFLESEVEVFGLEAEEKEDAPLTCDDAADAIGEITRKSNLPEQGLALFIQTGDMNVTVPVSARGLMIGRLATNDIVLHSRAVSKRHVFLFPCGWTVLVQDQGATNPAVLRGQEITGGQTMRLGDTLNICGTLLTLVEGRAATSDAS